jgi:Ca2+-binding EF-hand superfamily protein
VSRAELGEEQILYLLIEALQKSKIRTLAEAFELFDKEHRGSLSKEDFKDVFKSMSVHIEESEVDKFIEHFWRDQKAGIDYELPQNILEISVEIGRRQQKQGDGGRDPHIR